MSKCIDTRPVLVCYTDAAGVPQTLIQHIIYEEGIAIGQAYTTAADTETPIDVSAGTVVAGACPVAQPDVEWKQLCDVLADGTVVEFMCRTITRFNADGTVIDPVEVALFEMDKVTVYVPTGVVGACNEDCDILGSQGTLTAWADLA